MEILLAFFAGIIIIVLGITIFNHFFNKIPVNSVIPKNLKQPEEYKKPFSANTESRKKEDMCSDFVPDYNRIKECISRILEKYPSGDPELLEHLSEWHTSQMNICCESISLKEIKVPQDEDDTKGIRKIKEDLVFYDCYPVTYHELTVACNLINDISRKIERIKLYNCRVMGKSEEKKKELNGLMDKIKNLFNGKE